LLTKRPIFPRPFQRENVSESGQQKEKKKNNNNKMDTKQTWRNFYYLFHSTLGQAKEKGN